MLSPGLEMGTCEGFGDVGVVIEVAVAGDQEAAVARDAGWIGRGVLLLFLVTMLASSNF